MFSSLKIIVVMEPIMGAEAIVLSECKARVMMLQSPPQTLSHTHFSPLTPAGRSDGGPVQRRHHAAGSKIGL